jgi:hypothetical protein
LMPIRIQRKRTAGWKMPEGARYVGRPTVFGNPYDVETYGRELAIKLFAETAIGCWSPSLFPRGEKWDALVNAAYAAHCAWLKRIGPQSWETIRCELRGHDLACWCPLSEPLCHANCLLDIANA